MGLRFLAKLSIFLGALLGAWVSDAGAQSPATPSPAACSIQGNGSEEWCPLGNGDFHVSLIKGPHSGQTCFANATMMACGTFNGKTMMVTRVSDRTGDGSSFRPFNAVCEIKDGKWACAPLSPPSANVPPAAPTFADGMLGQIQRTCWERSAAATTRYTAYAECSSGAVGDRPRATYSDPFIERFLAQRLSAYRAIDAGTLTLEDWNRVGTAVLNAEAQKQQAVSFEQRLQQLQSQGYTCARVSPTQFDCAPPPNPFAGPAAILQGYAAGVQRYAPPSPVQCETYQVFGGPFPRWTTTCK